MKLKTLIPLESIQEGASLEDMLTKQFTGMIKVYSYTDPNKGYGMGDTEFYCKVSKSDFTIAEYGGSLALTDEAVSKLKKLGMNGFNHGWTFVKPADQKKAAKAAKEAYDKISKIKSI